MFPKRALSLLLLAATVAAADVGEIPLGVGPAELSDRLKPWTCRPVPDHPSFQICTYFWPPQTHRHLEVETLNTFAGLPVYNTSFTFRGGALTEMTLTFESRAGTPGGRTIDPRKLAAALETRFGTPTSRNRASIGRDGGIATDETVWERDGDRWLLTTYPAGGINVTLKRTRR